MDYAALMKTMQETGVGQAAVEGAWWSPAVQPVMMNSADHTQLTQIGRALFDFTDAVSAELRENPKGAFAKRLHQKVPQHIAQTLNFAPVLMFRPDLQLVPTAEGLQFVLTEIEIAPFSEGCAHAMQVAYGVSADIVPAFANMLNGRDLLFVGTHEWNQYQFDQLAFCKALATHGARGRVLYDRTVAQMEAEIACGDRWQELVADGEQASMTGHIARHQLEPFVQDAWPDHVEDAVIFRFGYVEHFTAAQHQLFKRWQAQGATFLNPFSFHLDSKVLLEGVHTPAIRQRLAVDTLTILERCVPETWLLTAERVDQLVTEKDDWLIKFAGFDQTNTAWGGRSVRFGRDFSAETWRTLLQNALALNWPTVAQRLAVSQQVSLEYYQPDGSIATQDNGFTRLRTFFLRNGITDPNPIHCGSHITINKGMNVSEASPDAIQTPVQFSFEFN